MECHNSELSILFTSDEHIKELNKTYRRKNRPTDVLAFSQKKGGFPDIDPTTETGSGAMHQGSGIRVQGAEFSNKQLDVLGDVVISTDTAKRQSVDLGHSVEKEIFILLIHGILHLLDFDHEKSKQDALKMESKEKELLGLIT